MLNLCFVQRLHPQPLGFFNCKLFLSLPAKVVVAIGVRLQGHRGEEVYHRVVTQVRCHLAETQQIPKNFEFLLEIFFSIQFFLAKKPEQKT